MITEPQPNYISDLFSIDSRFDYYIPKYQRSYIWKENHWGRLYDDIEKNESHFLGAIICINRRPGMRSAYEIVDGQQRITTIGIFFAALYKRMLELETDSTKFIDNSEQESFILERKNLGKRLLREHNLKLKLSFIKGDANNFESLLREVKIIDAPNPNSEYQSSLLYLSFSYLFSKISNKEPNDLLKIFNNLKNAHVIQIMADTTSSAYSIFESLNNTGEPLGPIDLIKNKFFRDLENVQNPDFSDENALGYWDIILTNIKEKEDQKDFLRHYSITFLLKERLMLRGYEIQGRNINEQLIDTYEKFLEKDPERFLKQFQHKSIYYSMFVNPEDKCQNVDLKKELIHLKYISAIPSRSFLLYIFSKFENNDPFKAQVVNLLNKYFIRHHITKFPDNRKLSKIFSDLVIKCKENDEISLEMIEDYLSDTANSSTLETFKNGLQTLKYSKSNSNFIRSIFSIIEDRYRNRENPKPFFERDEEGNFTWTLEHILPQTLTQSWIGTLHIPNGVTASDIHKEWVHTIGNLTITAYNSTYSNKPFLFKLKYEESEGNAIGLRNGRVFLNRDFDNWLDDDDHWTTDDITARRERLIAAISTELKYRNE